MTSPSESRPRSTPYLRLVVGLTVAVTIFAGAVAIWMYGLATLG